MLPRCRRWSSPPTRARPARRSSVSIAGRTHSARPTRRRPERSDARRAPGSVPAVETRYDELIAALRAAARPDRDPPADAVAYLDKVRAGAYRVTDDDVERLLAAGHGEDEIFE